MNSISKFSAFALFITSIIAISAWSSDKKSIVSHEYYCYHGWDLGGCSDKDGASWHDVVYRINIDTGTIVSTDYNVYFEAKDGKLYAHRVESGYILSDCDIVDSENWVCRNVDGEKAAFAEQLAGGRLIQSAKHVRGPQISDAKYLLHSFFIRLKFSSAADASPKNE
jgi:hypothetical protein